LTLGFGSPIAREGEDEGGVLCAFVMNHGRRSLLTCRHVLDPAFASAHAGGGVVGPTGGPPIATIAEWATVASDPLVPNPADWAIATLASAVPVVTTLPGGDTLNPNPLAASIGQSVTKASLTAPLSGIVVSTNADITIHFHRTVKRRFTNQILIRDLKCGVFAGPGESGTLVVAGNRPVGMIFAANLYRSDIPGVPVGVPLTAAFPLLGFFNQFRTLII
jgi:hypothetical protein